MGAMPRDLVVCALSGSATCHADQQACIEALFDHCGIHRQPAGRERLLLLFRRVRCCAPASSLPGCAPHAKETPVPLAEFDTQTPGGVLCACLHALVLEPTIVVCYMRV